MGIPGEDSATLTNNVDSVSSQEADSSRNEQKQTVDWEKRFKDTQASFTRSQQELTKVKAKLTVLETYTNELSNEEKDRLEDLKFSNPDEWFKEKLKLEKDAEQKYNDQINQVTTELTELDKRQLVLEDFQNSHPGFKLTDEIMTYDVPKRITNKLEKGEITFEEFLQETYSYLGTPKVIGDTNLGDKEPNLSDAGGGPNAANYAVEKDIKQSYKTLIF